MAIRHLRVSRLSALGAGLCAACGLAASASAVLIVPDNGFGTATIPPPTGIYDWDGISAPWTISSGLPPGTDVRSLPTTEWGGFAYGSDVPGGALGGNHQTFSAPITLHLVGSGTLAGYMRTVSFFTAGQTDTAPRVPFAPVQSFDTDLTNFQGQLPPGDPDFDLLRITAGTNFGMPSPGHTTLSTAGPGLWQVDSFFDITYRIDFVGHPGSPFGGMSGSTTGVVRMIIGNVPAPTSGALLAWGGLLAARRRRS